MFQLKKICKLLNEQSKNVAEKYDDLPEHEAFATTQTAIYEALESGSINTEMIAEKVFYDNESAKSLYREQISKKLRIKRYL